MLHQPPRIGREASPAALCAAPLSIQNQYRISGAKSDRKNKRVEPHTRFHLARRSRAHCLPAEFQRRIAQHQERTAFCQGSKENLALPPPCASRDPLCVNPCDWRISSHACQRFAEGQETTQRVPGVTRVCGSV